MKVIVLFFTLLAFADLKVPDLTGPVVDKAKLLSVNAEEKISSLIRAVNNTGKAQVSVLTLPDLDGETIEQASIKVVDKWKLGGEKSDNGVLILLAVKERAVRIEVGQGLEGDIPDALTKRIIEDFMVPQFKNGDFGAGIIIGVQHIAHLVGAKVSSSDEESQWRGGRKISIETYFYLLIFIIFFIGPYFTGRRGRKWRQGMAGYSNSWGSSGPSGWGSSSGWGGGSSSWGGGGGGFSGGGASGRW